MVPVLQFVVLMAYLVGGKLDKMAWFSKLGTGFDFVGDAATC